jgi:hypothetical protein
MATTATPPLMRPSALRGYFETSLYLLLLVSVLALVSTGKLDLVSMLAAPAALLLKGYRWWRGRGAELSSGAANWLVVAYIPFFPLDVFWLSRSLSVGAQNPALFSALLATIHLVLFAMIVRLFSARTTRDCLFLALLAFSAILAAAILTVDTAFIGFFLVFLALGVSTFTAFEMWRSAEGAAWTPLQSGTPAARRLHRALSFTSIAVALCAILAGTIIFLVIPRFRAGYLSGFNLQSGLISGFSDEVELGRIGEIQQSNAVVMRIRVEGDDTRAQGLHWRGIALTSFDGRRWFTDERQNLAASQSMDEWIHLRRPGGAASRRQHQLRYSVLLEPMASDSIFVAAEPLQIRGQFNSNAAAGRAIRRVYLLQDQTGSLSNPFRNFANVRYEAISELPRASDEELRSSAARYSASIRNIYLQLPSLDPRIPALARQIAGNARTPLDQARAIERYLPSNYLYSLDLAGPAPSDPLAHFLFERRAGHCEYFAAAMTVLLRSLGIPARYVNGFLGGDYNDIGGDFIIRARHAHSWVEVYFPEYGWVTFDPTPPAGDRPVGLLTRLSFYWDWVELQWSEWVINYDFLHQDTLVQGARTLSRDWTFALRHNFELMRTTGADRLRLAQEKLKAAPPWFYLALAAFAAMALFLANAAVRERVALAWRLRMGAATVPAEAAAQSYGRMLRLLERRGWTKSASQTPLEFAEGLVDSRIGPPVARLTQVYQSARFGGQSPNARTLTSLLADVQAVLRNRQTHPNNLK